MANVLDENKCPFCKGENNCMAKSKDPCWCCSKNIKVPAELTDWIPAAAKRKACLCLSCINSFNQNLIKEIHKDGRIFLSTTTVSGNFWLRVAIVVFRTHKDTIDRTLELLVEKVNVINSQPDFAS